MTNNPLVSHILAAALSCTLFIASPAPSQASPQASGADVVMVLDLSGSMKSRGGARRYEEIFEWISHFSTPKDRVAVVAMGYGARLVAPLVASDDLSFDELRPALRLREKFTDVAAGLESAYYQLKTTSSKSKQRIILLYSDAQIDMPGGDWESRNSLRYIQESLNPSLVNDRIQLVAVVPDGLKANFQLLHELTHKTGGAYYRGIPEDPDAARSKVDIAAKAKVKATQPSLDKSKTKQIAKKKKPASKNQTLAAPKEKRVIVERVVQESSATWMIALFVVFGIALLGMFGFVFYLFRNTTQKREPETEREISKVLEDVHALRQINATRVKPEMPHIDEEESEDPATMEESEDPISMSMVSPFLDYADSNPKIRGDEPTDQILIKPAFDTDDAFNENLSVSNMEDLIGTSAPEAEQNKE